jgi:HlyD family secretion protein
MNKKLVVLVVVLAGAGAMWAWWPTEAAAVPPASRDLYTVKRADLRIAITENGTMVAKDSQKIDCKLKGDSGTIAWLIEEGKKVAEGDEVCKLDPAKVQKAIEEIKDQILQTQNALEKAIGELAIQKDEAVANETKANVELERAQKDLEKYTDGDAPQERRKLELTIKDSLREYNKAHKEIGESEKLLAQNYIQKSEYEQNQIAFEKAAVAKERAELDLRNFEKYDYPIKLKELQTKLADSGRGVEHAKRRGATGISDKELAVKLQEKQLKDRNSRLKDQEEQLANMTLKAPCPGIVVYGDPHEPYYRDRIKVGGQVWGDFTIATIPDLRIMQVKLQIHEANYSSIKEGLTATVTTDAYPGMVLEGDVTHLAAMASGDRWGGSSEIKKFDVVITLKSTGEKQLRHGISAKAEILVDTRKQALFVPQQCVFTETGEHFCHVMQPDGLTSATRKVTIGLSNDTYVEILDGLAEGDRVLLYNPSLPTGVEAKGGDKGDKADAGGAKDGVADKTPAAPAEASASNGKSGS